MGIMVDADAEWFSEPQKMQLERPKPESPMALSAEANAEKEDFTTDDGVKCKTEPSLKDLHAAHTVPSIRLVVYQPNNIKEYTMIQGDFEDLPDSILTDDIKVNTDIVSRWLLETRSKLREPKHLPDTPYFDRVSAITSDQPMFPHTTRLDWSKSASEAVNKLAPQGEGPPSVLTDCEPVSTVTWNEVKCSKGKGSAAQDYPTAYVPDPRTVQPGTPKLESAAKTDYMSQVMRLSQLNATSTPESSVSPPSGLNATSTPGLNATSTTPDASDAPQVTNPYARHLPEEKKAEPPKVPVNLAAFFN